MTSLSPSDIASIDETLAVFEDQQAEFIKIVLADAETYFTQLDDAGKNNDSEHLCLAAHAFKTVMKQVGAITVADYAHAVETDGRNGKTDVYHDSISDMTSAYHAVKDYLESMVA